MRGVALGLVALLLVLGLSPAATGDTGLTVGIIRTGADPWTLSAVTVRTQLLEGQLRADRPSTIEFGIPDLASCSGCDPSWFRVRFLGTDPPLTAGTLSSPENTTLRIENAAWDHARVLRVRFAVDGQISPDAAEGTWPLDLGVLARPDACPHVCIEAGALSRVMLTVPPRPQIVLDVVESLETAGLLHLTGSVTGAAPLASVLWSVDEGLTRPAQGLAQWAIDTDTAALDEGPHTLRIVAKDQQGRTDAVTVPFVVDRSAPRTTIVSPAANSVSAQQTTLLGIPLSGSAVAAGSSTLRVDAHDTHGTITTLTVCHGPVDGPGATCHTAPGAPYVDDAWNDDAPPGEYRITAWSEDRSGNRSPTVTRTVLFA